MRPAVVSKSLVEELNLGKKNLQLAVPLPCQSHRRLPSKQCDIDIDSSGKQPPLLFRPGGSSAQFRQSQRTFLPIVRLEMSI